VRVPGVAVAAIVKFAVSCAAELNVQLLTVTPAPKTTCRSTLKVLPLIPTLVSVCPCAPVFGFTPLTVGAGG